MQVLPALYNFFSLLQDGIIHNYLLKSVTFWGKV